MEDITSHHQSTLPPTQIKRMGPNVKFYLEKWYQAKGKPKTITLAEKTSIIYDVKSEIDPVGVTVGQLNRWFADRRRLEEHLEASRLKHSSVGILFPTLTNPEIDHMKILVGANPNPSSDLITLWVESPLLPNLTIEDAHRFIRFNQVERQTDTKPTVFMPALRQDDAGGTDQSDEEATVDSHVVPTPESTSSERNLHTSTLGSNIPSRLHHETEYMIDGASPMLSTASIQLSHDPRALLSFLRSQFSTDELKQLLQEGNNTITTMPSTTLPNAEPIVSINHASSKSQLPSPISPLLRKSADLFTEAGCASPGETAGSSDSSGNGELSRRDSSSHQNNTSDSMNESTASVASLGVISRKILKDLSRLWLAATRSYSGEPIERLELCQKRSEELLVALERGDFKEFGILPRNELSALSERPGAVEVLSDVTSSMSTNCVIW